MRQLLILLSLTFQFQLSAALLYSISDNDTPAQLYRYAHPKAFFIFNIDNTLIRSSTYLGSNRWYEQHDIKPLLNAGYTREEAKELTEDSWLFVMKDVEMVPVDRELLSLIDHLKERKIPYIAITNRPESSRELTMKQCKQLNIELPLGEESIFCVDQNRHIERLLSALPNGIDTLVCVDDCMPHIESCMECAKQRGLSYFGLRLSKCDELPYHHEAALKQYKVLLSGLTKEEIEYLKQDAEGSRWLKNPSKIPPNEIAELLLQR